MSFATALQTAIHSRLSNYPGMPAVKDDVSATLPFPYVVVGEDTHIPWDTDDSTGAESTITLHIWSRQRGKKETQDIQGLIYTALNRYEMAVSGYHLVTMEFEYSEVTLDPDGQTRHGISRFRTLIEAEDSSTA